MSSKNTIPMFSQFIHLPSVNLYLVAVNFPSCWMAIRSTPLSWLVLRVASLAAQSAKVLNASETVAIERVGREKRDDHLLPAGARRLGGRRLLADLNYEICV